MDQRIALYKSDPSLLIYVCCKGPAVSRVNIRCVCERQNSKHKQWEGKQNGTKSTLFHMNKVEPPPHISPHPHPQSPSRPVKALLHF